MKENMKLPRIRFTDFTSIFLPLLQFFRIIRFAHWKWRIYISRYNEFWHHLSSVKCKINIILWEQWNFRLLTLNGLQLKVKVAITYRGTNAHVSFTRRWCYRVNTSLHFWKSTITIFLYQIFVQRDGQKNTVTSRIVYWTRT